MRTILSLILCFAMAGCEAQSSNWENKKRDLSKLVKNWMDNAAKRSGASVADTFTVLSIDSISEQRSIQLFSDRYVKAIKEQEEMVAIIKNEMASRKEELGRAKNEQQKELVSAKIASTEKDLIESETLIKEGQYSLDSCNKVAMATDPNKHYGYFVTAYISVVDRTAGKGVRSKLGFLVSESEQITIYQFPYKAGEFFEIQKDQ